MKPQDTYQITITAGGNTRKAPAVRATSAIAAVRAAIKADERAERARKRKAGRRATVAAALLGMLATTDGCGHAPEQRPGLYECAEQCAAEHPDSVAFGRRSCVAECRGRPAPTKRAPGSG